MSERRQRMRALVTERLTAAAEEIFALFEEELCRSNNENQRRQQLLELALSPTVRLHRTVVNVEGQLYNSLDSSYTDNDDDWTAPVSASPAPMETEEAEPCFPESVGELEPGPVKTSHQNSIKCNTFQEFKCTICENDYYDAHGLKRHMYIHTGERPYRCSVCGKGFIRKDHLIAHMRIHTGERPFSCPFCTKAFHYSAGVKNHMKTHTKEGLCSASVIPSPRTEGQQLNSSVTHSDVKMKEEQIIEQHNSVDSSNDDRTAPVSPSPAQTETKEAEQCPPESEEELEPDVKMKEQQIVEEQHNSVDSSNSDGTAPVSASPTQMETEAEQCPPESVAGLESDSGKRRQPNVKYCTQCPMCKRRVSSTTQLKRHIFTHTEERPFRCQVCPKGFIRKDHFARHMYTHTGKKPFCCPVCKEGFVLPSKFKRHVKTHAKERPCSSSVSTVPSTEGHGLSSSVTCSDVNVEELQIIVDSTDQQHANESFTVQDFKCSFCEKILHDANSLKRHIFTHTGERPFSCPVCNKGFYRKDQLSNHKRTHSQEKPFRCSVCNKGFYYTRSLGIHMKTHTEGQLRSSSVGPGPSTEGHQLNSSVTRSGVNMEEQQVIEEQHITNSSEQCPVGGLEIGSVKRRQCPICRNTFSNVTDLKRHMFIHTGERPFRCTVCNKGFIRKDALANHKRIHTREKPFSCSVCNQRFPVSSMLKSHMKTHAKEKPCSSSVSTAISTEELNSSVTYLGKCLHSPEEDVSCGSVPGFHHFFTYLNHGLRSESPVSFVLVVFAFV